MEPIHFNNTVLKQTLSALMLRNRVTSMNIANIETPGYRPTDVSPQAFQAALRDAIDDGRREKGGALVFDDSAPIAFTEEGTVLKPEVLAENIMFHDGNDRSMERIMQKLTENVYTFRMASQMLRNQFESLNMAIRERF